MVNIKEYSFCLIYVLLLTSCLYVVCLILVIQKMYMMGQHMIIYTSSVNFIIHFIISYNRCIVLISSNIR